MTAHDHAVPLGRCRAGRDGFAQLLRAEWTKFRTVRGWVIGMVVAALVIVLARAARRRDGSRHPVGPQRPELGPPAPSRRARAARR